MMSPKRKIACLVALLLALAMYGIDAVAGDHGVTIGVLQKPFAMGVLGFVGAWALIIVSKMIMAPLLQRDENYYEEGEDADDNNE